MTSKNAFQENLIVNFNSWLLSIQVRNENVKGCRCKPTLIYQFMWYLVNPEN